MVKKSIFLLLALVSTGLAAPQDYDYSAGGDSADQCSKFFEDADKSFLTELGIDEVTIAEKLTYGCSAICNDGRQAAGVTPFAAAEIVVAFINSAQNGICPNTGEVCCNIKFIPVPIPEPEPSQPKVKKCGDIDKYTCVSNIMCLGDASEDPNMTAICESEFTETRSVTTQICCNDDKIKQPPPKCSDPKLADNEYRCAPKDKCLKNSIDKRSSLPIITPAILAETAECDTEGEVCCHDADIKRPCTDYGADGYKCSDKCIDLPQDFPKAEDRKSGIKYYDPKNTHCERAGHVCCIRTEKIKPAPCPDGSKPPCAPPEDDKPHTCESWGEGFKCSRMELCDPDTFAVIEAPPEVLKENTVNDLFSTSELFTQNDADGVAVNTDLVPCESPLAVCCVPEKEKEPPKCPDGSDEPCEPVPPPICPDGSDLPCKEVTDEPTPCPDGNLPDADGNCEVCKPKPPPEGFPTQCGTHNPNGIVRGGVTAKQTGASTQEGEWPHACLVFNGDTTIGGASLIAPGVLLTAAHLLEIKEGGTITKMEAGNMKVRCGEWDLASSDFETFAHQDRNVDSYTIHPFYSGQRKNTTIQLANDIAIIHVKDEFEFAPNVNTICLPSFDKPTIKGLCTSMGWGVNSPEAEAIGEDIMKQVRLNEEVERDLCQNAILGTGKVAKVWQLHESWICAQASKEESPDNILCKGDGGGPLVCQEQGSDKHVLSGIIAFGIGCGNKEIPDVFASVHNALCFIDYDVKCKHGEKYITHFDYQKDCATWYDDEVERLKKIPLKIFQRQLNKLKNLATTCVPDEISLAFLGARQEGVVTECFP